MEGFGCIFSFKVHSLFKPLLTFFNNAQSKHVKDGLQWNI